MSDTSLKIIFTNSEPSLALIYDERTGLHSIYRIRNATSEECQLVNGSADNTSFNYNSMLSSSLHHAGNSGVGGKSSTSKTFVSNLGNTIKLNIIICFIYK